MFNKHYCTSRMSIALHVRHLMNAGSNLKRRIDAVLANSISANRLTLSRKLSAVSARSYACHEPHRFPNLADFEYAGCSRSISTHFDCK